MSFTDTLCCIDFEFLVSSNLVIGCVSGYASCFLNPVGELCVDMAPCWSGSLHVHACQSPSMGDGQRTSGCWDCL